MSHTFSFICIKLIATPLRHVQGFPLLGLLWEFRCHAGYSEAQPHSPLAFRFRQSTFRQVLTIGTADSSDATFVSFRLLRLRCDILLDKLQMQGSCLSTLWQFQLPFAITTSIVARLSFNQSRLHPHVCRSPLRFSRTMTVR